jgi:hypothetical protein
MGGVLGVYSRPIVPRPVNTSDSHSCERPTAVPERPNRPESGGSREQHFSERTLQVSPSTGYHRLPQVTTGYHRLPYGYPSFNKTSELAMRKTDVTWSRSLLGFICAHAAGPAPAAGGVEEDNRRHRIRTSDPKIVLGFPATSEDSCSLVRFGVAGRRKRPRWV